MTLSKNNEAFNFNTAATCPTPQPQTASNTQSIVIVNANTALARVLEAELSTQLPHITQYHEHWHTVLECRDALSALNHEALLWIICTDDDNPEILDFIDGLYQAGERAIIAIDTRAISMPSMWLSYYKAGTSACITGQTPTGLSQAINWINQHRGLLNIEGQIKRFRRHHHAHFSALELALLELLFDRELLIDLDEGFSQQLTRIEKDLLEQLYIDHLSTLLPVLAEIFWQHKHQGVAKAKPKANPALSIAIVTTEHSLFHKLKERLLQSRKIAEITMHHSTQAVLTHTTQNNPAPDLIVLHLSDDKSITELQRSFQPLKYLSATTKKLVMGTETNINTPAMAYFKASSQGYIDQAASLSLWECAIDTIHTQEKQFWQLLQQPIAAYTITDSAKVLAREVGGIFTR